MLQAHFDLGIADPLEVGEVEVDGHGCEYVVSPVDDSEGLAFDGLISVALIASDLDPLRIPDPEECLPDLLSRLGAHCDRERQLARLTLRQAEIRQVGNGGRWRRWGDVGGAGWDHHSLS